MAEHRLKTLLPYWLAVDQGLKTFELRYDDRGYMPGDTLILLAVDVAGQETGQVCERRVGYVMGGGRYGLLPGYVAMALVNPVADVRLHMTRTDELLPGSWGWLCRCGDSSEGFTSQASARAAAERHLAATNRAER